MLASFLFFLSCFVFIGLASLWRSRATKQDYYLASGTVAPWLVGLSAVATNNSGYMFIGVIGYTYTTGLAAAWVMVAWILGDFLASLFVHRRLRAAAERSQALSYAGVLANWHGEQRWVRRSIALISLIFLTAYASAQLVAGSKALHVLLDWPQWAGAAVGATMVALYCCAGGIRASIWTDAAQSVVMMGAMALLVWVSVSALGGLNFAFTRLQSVPEFMNWIPSGMVVPGVGGLLLFALGWVVAGFSVIGQPHIMVRFMTLTNAALMRRARVWYYGWFIVFYVMATVVGLLARVLLPDVGNFDAELALPTMAVELLPPFLVGLVLAGIFAATMSTADSLVLSCSSALSQDMFVFSSDSAFWLKLTTITVTFLALLLALSENQSVFEIVILSWSGLAAAFAPLLLMRSVGFRSSERVATTAILAGFTATLSWHYANLSAFIYEGVPGVLVGLLILLLFRRRGEAL